MLSSFLASASQIQCPQGIIDNDIHNMNFLIQSFQVLELAYFHEAHQMKFSSLSLANDVKFYNSFGIYLLS